MRKNYLFDGVLRSEEATVAAFDETVDVLVAGLGSGGCYAALAAARNGASVLAFDRAAEIGGMSVAGWVAYYYYGFGGGDFEDTDARAARRAGIFARGGWQPAARVSALLVKFAETGVRIAVRTVLSALYMEGNTVVGAELYSEGKRTRVACNDLIDATSDGHIIRLCGVKTYFGRASDGTAAPFSAQTLVYTAAGKAQARFGDSGKIDPFCENDLTRKVLLSRTHHLDHRAPGGVSLGTAELPGLREGLRFEGEETLDYRRVISFEKPERVLFYAYSDLDKHGHDTALDEDAYQDYWMISNLSTLTIRIPVPFGAVIPKGIEGIVTACRCLSADPYIVGAVRMNRDMFRLGECVGTGAALAAKTGCRFASLSYDAYRRAVEGSAAFAGDANREHGFDFPPGNGDRYTPVSFEKDADTLARDLDSDRPAASLYAARLYPEKTRPALLAILAHPASERQETAAAIALGMIGGKEALPALRRAVKRRAPYYYLDCRRSNQFPSADAICLLGRLGEAEDIPLLEEIVLDPAECGREMYHTLAPAYIYSNAVGVNYVLYLHCTHALMALVKLAERLGKLPREAPKLRARLTGESRAQLRAAITPQGEGEVWYEEVESFFDVILTRIGGAAT